jgi:signal transduction histidine kinase
LPGATAFFAASIATLSSDAAPGLGALLAGESGAGRMARRLLPAALLIPATFGWLRLEGQYAGFYGTAVGLALFAASNIVCFTALILWNARSLHGAETAAIRAAARLRTLADASRAFAVVATDYRRLLESVVSIASEVIGDGCLVTLLASDGKTLTNAANAHRDPTIAEDYRQYLLASSTHDIDGKTVAARVARTGEARLVPQIAPEVVVAQSDETLKPLVKRLNVHGFIVVPIRAHGRIIGTLSLLRSRPDEPYTKEDALLLQDLADRAGLAIENARLYGSLERRVEDRTRELAELNRELETFSYSVAHDLKAPIRAVAGFSHALVEDLASALGEEQKQYLSLIARSAEHMNELIDALLELSHLARAELVATDVDLSELSRGILVALGAAEPERKVTIRIASGLRAHGDPRLLTALLQNLLANAWKFTRATGDARIEVGTEGPHDDPIFFVRDNGAGFNMAHAQKLFVPFQRFHRAGEFEGTGIGLATVQRIVRRHAGRLWAQSTENEGATFYFTLGSTVNSPPPPRSPAAETGRLDQA